MAYRYVVLGAGRQGAALAYDLARHGEAAQVLLADMDAETAEAAARRVGDLVADRAACLGSAVCDVSDPESVAPLLSGADVVVSAAPYRFNVTLTDLAIAAGASFCDLGGNTEVVRQQLTRDHRATAAGVSVLPDCGLAPGLGNILAAHGIAGLDEPQDVHIRCGGLPQRPVGPLGYKLTFNFEGLINEYGGHGAFLREGRYAEIPALTELEEIEFPPPVGRCEAAVTSGGTSTAPRTYAGRLRTYDYKTVRYPGHFAVMQALFALGCFEQRIGLPAGGFLEPRPVLRTLMEMHLAYPEVRDLVVLRVTVSGRQRGRPATRRYELMDFEDVATGFTAMERTTAFPAALVAHMQARGRVPPGAKPLEQVLPLEQYVEELPRHGIRVAIAESE
ncbi:MAG: saccharopine dehydrogenase C-terminal domain-containing protein [Planctomycetota bacterium]